MKIYANGKVVVLLIEKVRMGDAERLQKYYLQDDGAWRLLNEGESYMPLANVFVEDKNDPTVDLTK